MGSAVPPKPTGNILAAGTYRATVTDANGCSIVTSNQIIGQPAVLSINVSAKTDATCGSNNGTIDFTINGVSSSYASTIVKLGATTIQTFGAGTSATTRSLILR